MSGSKPFLSFISPKLVSTILSKAIHDDKESSSELKQNALYVLYEWSSKYTFINGVPSEFYKATEKLKKSKLKPVKGYIDPLIYSKKFESAAPPPPPPSKALPRRKLSREWKEVVADAKAIISKVCKRIDYWIKDKTESAELESEVKTVQKRIAEEVLSGNKEKEVILLSSSLRELPSLMAKLKKDDMKAKLKLMEIYNAIDGSKATLMQSPAIIGRDTPKKDDVAIGAGPAALSTPTSRPTINDSIKVSQKKLESNESPQEEDIRISDKRETETGAFKGLSVIPAGKNEWFSNVPSSDVWGNALSFGPNEIKFPEKKHQPTTQPVEPVTEEIKDDTEIVSEIIDLERQFEELTNEKENIGKLSKQLEDARKDLLLLCDSLTEEYKETSAENKEEINELTKVLSTKKSELEDKKSDTSSILQSIQEEFSKNKAYSAKLSEALKAAEAEIRSKTAQDKEIEKELKELLKQEADIKEKLKQIEDMPQAPPVVVHVPELNISPIMKSSPPETSILSSDNKAKEEVAAAAPAAVAEESDKASSGTYHTPPQTSPEQNVAVSPEITSEFKVSPTMEQAARTMTPESQGEARYKSCLTSLNGIWHEDSVILLKISRTVNVPMKSAAYKLTFENKMPDSTLHIKRFEPLAFDSKGIFVSLLLYLLKINSTSNKH